MANHSLFRNFVVRQPYTFFRMRLHFITSILAGGIAAAAALAASPVLPTVKQGSFYSFPGMNISAIPADDAPATLRRVDKLGNSQYDNTDGHDLREVPVQGDYRVLVILADFQDVEFSASRQIDINTLVKDMLNGQNFTFQDATGSANAFFRYTSCGQFNPIFDVYGPVKMSQNEREYVTPSEKETYVDPATGKTVEVYPAGKMIREAVLGIDAEVDFSKYDSNGDGCVDFVYVFFPGQGATTGGDRYSTIWPHAFTLEAALGSALELDGVKINRYATSSELGTNKKLSGIGTFCHEFSHVLGLPDLYDTANNGSANAVFTPGTFDTMDAGNYNNSEHTPPVFSAYERYAMEWMCPTTLTGGGNITLLPLTARNFAYKIPTRNADTEYYLLEARAPKDYDQYLECHGLAVWHIDYKKSIWDNNCPNNNARHRHIQLVEADYELSRGTRNGDLFPGAQGICEFNADMSPSFTDWADQSTGFDLSNIRLNPDGTVSMCVNHSTDMPGLSLSAPTLRLTAASTSTLDFAWDAADGATGYMLSIYEADKHKPGEMISEFAEGYYFRDLGNVTHFTATGLTPGKAYCAIIYAYNALNAARPEIPLCAYTHTGNFDTARTTIYATASGRDVHLDWDAVEGADSYRVEAFLPSEPAVANAITVDCNNSSLPGGWSSNCSFDSRDKYAGSAAPSIKMSANGGIITSPVFANNATELTLHAIRNYSDGDAILDVYTTDSEGITSLTSHITDIAATKGNVIKVSLPQDTRQIALVYTTLSTGQNVFIDDITVSLADDAELLPAPVSINFTSPTHAVMTDAQPDALYAVRVTPVKHTPDNADTEGAASRLLYITPSTLPAYSSTDIVVSDHSATTPLFNLQGMPVSRPIAGEIYICNGKKIRY